MGRTMYDARSRTTSVNGDLVFVVIAVVVVALAFVAAWTVPGLLGGKSQQPPTAAVTAPVPPPSGGSTPVAMGALAKFDSPSEQRYLNAVNRLTPKAITELEAKIAAGNLDATEELRIVQKASGEAFLQNLDHLAHVSTADLNAMLDTTIKHLRSARQSQSKLCDGSFLASFENKSARQTEAMLRRAGFTEEAFAEYAFDVAADMLEMLDRAKRTPARHGKMNKSDEAALQGLMMSLMSDPTLMQLAMAGNDPSALKSVNVCSVGISLLNAVKTLPDGTKGRAWAAMFDQPDVRRALKQAEGFQF